MPLTIKARIEWLLPGIEEQMERKNRQTAAVSLSQSEGLVRAAGIYSNIASPPIVFSALGFAIAWASYPFWQGLAWGFLYGGLISGVPMLAVAFMLKTGRIGDLHIRDRRERNLPYLITVICAVIATIIAHLFGASQLLRSLLLCSIMGLAALALINLFWQISNHAASIMLATTFAWFSFGPAVALALGPFCCLTVAARLILKRHTVAQLLAGLLVGAAPVLILAAMGLVG